MHSYLIVIYNQSVFDSPTYQTLLAMLQAYPHAAELYIWDNSPEPQHKSQITSILPDLKINYFCSGKNENLSVVYNRTMENCFLKGSTYLTIFDQDSQVSLDFKKLIEGTPAECLLVPKVYSDRTGELISPRYQRYNYLTNKCSVEYLDKSISAGFFESKFMFAVGSGMTLSRQLWNSGLRFNEELSFYGVDTEFCHDYAIKNDFFYMFDAEVHHSASNETEENYEKFKWRLTKYFEHWEYQLVHHAGMSQNFATTYASVMYLILKYKNKLKRILFR